VAAVLRGHLRLGDRSAQRNQHGIWSPEQNGKSLKGWVRRVLDLAIPFVANQSSGADDQRDRGVAIGMAPADSDLAIPSVASARPRRQRA
jgi:hypothetical protein